MNIGTRTGSNFSQIVIYIQCSQKVAIANSSKTATVLFRKRKVRVVLLVFLSAFKILLHYVMSQSSKQARSAGVTVMILMHAH